MGSKKKNRNQAGKEKRPIQQYNYNVPARNLPKSDLGAVIFGCKSHTIDECFSKLLFGLPFGHFAYVKKVSAGMPLFLFNYSDRKLLGTFEAAGPGKLNIDPYAWTNGVDGETDFPAQVNIKMFESCYSLKEDQFYPIIADNYYDQSCLFWFEMDHSQTEKMINLFSSSAQSYARPSHHHRPTATLEAGCSILRNRYNAPLPYDGGPNSPLPEDYNGGEWESCSSPPISKSEHHEACRENIDQGEKESNYSFIEGPGVYSGEWEGEADNVGRFKAPFVEAPEDILSMLMQEVQLLKEKQIKQEERIQALEKELTSKRASKQRCS
ncbi:unnamed protein product [Cuscuta europaea]|uniref:DCD domain-containing protein n=1 Tax=Cuscuta europaea TaxID=41803 RepID=A0A9P0ZY03_CUSEU|nr:unnamed protein product [Cuscuta europaea]